MANANFVSGGPSYPNNSIAILWDDGVFFIFGMVDGSGNTMFGGFYHFNYLAGQLAAPGGGAQNITEAGPDTSSGVETLKYTHRRQPSANSSVTIISYDDDPAKQVTFTSNMDPSTTFTAQLIYSVAG